jgi:diguanylate cyclase (GGDEF)-like protein/PAS domain S-box-containing protein
MKWQSQNAAVVNLAIAASAIMTGAMIGLRFAPGNVDHGSQFYASGSSSLAVAGFVLFALITAGLVVLKSIEDRRYQMERELLDAFLEHIPDNVFFKDRDSRFVRISRAMANYFGLADPRQAVGKVDSDVFSSEHAGQALSDEQEIMHTGIAKVGIEEKETWPDGRESWVLTSKIPLKNRRGEIIGTMGIAHDITDRKQAELRIRYMALHDGLTGLANRVLLGDRLSQAISLGGRNQRSVAVLMLDLDRFKIVNDSFGHYVGDRLLEEVSRRLLATLRESDIVARLGGDEFVIGIPFATSRRDVEIIAQKVLDAVNEPLEIVGHKLQMTTSIGISMYPPDAENAESLLQYADAAMYEAKKNGRNSYCFFTPELTKATRRRQKLENDLYQALNRSEFAIHYQPLVSTCLGRITGVEALLRWYHPEEGLISPIEFIPQLEELGLMVEVGDWVLRTACLQNVAWQQEGLPRIRVSVNVSAQQFYRGDIAGSVSRILRETGLDPEYLELELTESLTLDDSEATIKIMHDLKRTGVSLSLDDFGTGWSSLSYLRRFPIDRLKIDRSFMRDIASDPAAEAVVRSILSLGSNLGLDCVAEGVETHQQLEYLQEQLCAEMQGFLYSPALPAAECGKLLRSAEPEKKGIAVLHTTRFNTGKHKSQLAS